MIHADLVSVYHNDRNYKLFEQLRAALAHHEPKGGYRLIGVDNRERNRGFAVGCNLGARHPDATARVIGFLNPDVEVTGPFLAAATKALVPPVVITGCRYGKEQRELDIWGVNEWVCGAAMFVARDWFQAVGGFDEQFTWSWEETDLIRQAETQGYQCRAIELPINHQSPVNDPPADRKYKQFNFAQGQKRYARKWAHRRF